MVWRKKNITVIRIRIYSNIKTDDNISVQKNDNALP